MTPSNTATGSLIDRYGRLKAEAADLDGQMKDIKSELIARGIERDEGELFRITISESLRETTDWKAVALALAKRAAIGEKAFDNLVAKNTNVAEVVTLRCSARITSGKGAA